jgi:hypothetical protein
MAACGGTTASAPESEAPAVTATEPPAAEQPATDSPLTGDIAPDFALPDSNGNDLMLSDELKNNQTVVLVFYNAHD